MLKTERIKKQIDILPEAMLDEIERLIFKLKTSKKAGTKKPSVLSQLAKLAAEVDLPEDFSKQHDHYLYGLPKK